ncbi:MAG: HdeD family acid-resistance protein [Armatimonadota bacterium]
MSMEQSHIQPVRSVVGSWWLSMLIGFGLILLGLASIVGLFVFTVAVAILMGIVLVVAGVLLGATALSENATAGSKALGVVIALVAFGAGIYMLVNPKIGLSVAALVLGILFPIEGIAKIAMSFGMRDIPRWYWITASGAASIGLGVVIWANGIAGAASFVGLLLGIDLIVFGFALILIALSTRSSGFTQARASSH